MTANERTPITANLIRGNSRFKFAAISVLISVN